VAATYTYAQLEGLWINAGGSAATAPVAAAIAEAESGGVSNAAYPSTTVADGQGSNTVATGLWQILGVPAGFTPAQLTDPAANAQMAVAKYEQAGNSFSPWVTYTNGQYKAKLSNSTTPDTTGLPTATATTTAATATPAASAATCLLLTPAIDLGVTSVPQLCLLSKVAARTLVGYGLLGAAGIVGLAAAVILAASAFEHSGAASAVTQSVAPVRAVVNTARKAAPS